MRNLKDLLKLLTPRVTLICGPTVKCSIGSGQVVQDVLCLESLGQIIGQQTGVWVGVNSRELT